MKFPAKYALSCCGLGYACYALLTSLSLGVFTVSEVLAETSASSRLIETPARELLFEENRGQFLPSIDYLARGPGYIVELALSPTIELHRTETARSFTLRIIGANASAEASPLEPQATLSHYLSGEQSSWKTDIPNFKRIRYERVLDHIDVEYYGNDRRLEYDFVVHPGGDPDNIRVAFDGAQGLEVDSNGDLIIDLGTQNIVQKAPVAFQIATKGERIPIDSAYTLRDGTVGFELAAWDRSKPLIIDPVLDYSTYYGGTGGEISAGVDIDAAGNIYVIATTSSMGLATGGAYSEEITPLRREIFSYPFCIDCTDTVGNSVERVSLGGPRALLITKFSPDAQSVLWSTYFNLPCGDNCRLGNNSAKVSDAGEVAFGITDAGGGLPLVNQTQAYDANQDSGYVAKLNASGNGLVFGSYLHFGNTLFSWLWGLDVSASGKVAVSGMLSGNNTFPVVVGIPGQSCTLNVATNERSEGFLALFGETGTLVFSSCLGGDVRAGPTQEGLRGVAIGNNGHLYTVGYSSMTDFPVVNPIQATKNLALAREMTISQVDPETGQLIFSTWFGPTAQGFPPIGEEYYDVVFNFFPYDITTDSNGNIIVAGSIGSLSYPAINALQSNMATPRESAEFLVPPYYGPQSIAYLTDYYVTKLQPGSGTVFSTLIGGSQGEDALTTLAVDLEDNIYLTGVTASDNYPLLNPIQAVSPSAFSQVLSKITPQGALAFSTYIGGSTDYATLIGASVAVNSSGTIVLAGSTASSDFPIVGSGTALSGATDITLALIDQSGDVDTDGDGVPDSVDAFPADALEWRNLDGDLIGDNTDLDDDGDGVPDASDRFPQDSLETVDSDEDGAGDNRDEFDNNPYNYFDFDGDGSGNFDLAEVDDDNDGIPDATDAFDFDATESVDTDGDWIGNNADLDDDGDQVPDTSDTAPLDSQIPTMNFENYIVWNTTLFKSPWPVGFADVQGADLPWTSAEDQSFNGIRSFGSRIIDHGQASSISYTAVFEVGFVKFRYKVSSQAGADVFTFKLNDQTLITESGDSGWQEFTVPVSAGNHTLEWRYAKNGSITEGSDAAWFDDLEIIGDTIFESGFE